MFFWTWESQKFCSCFAQSIFFFISVSRSKCLWGCVPLWVCELVEVRYSIFLLMLLKKSSQEEDEQKSKEILLSFCLSKTRCLCCAKSELCNILRKSIFKLLEVLSVTESVDKLYRENCLLGFSWMLFQTYSSSLKFIVHLPSF